MITGSSLCLIKFVAYFFYRHMIKIICFMYHRCQMPVTGRNFWYMQLLGGGRSTFIVQRDGRRGSYMAEIY